jgi:DNA (cytosine-5)-methyltransferase 1
MTHFNRVTHALTPTHAPRLLDLFCCAGGAARGYQMAGFHVTGIDNRKQPRYAGDTFVQADALEYVAEHGHEYDCIHASPPCQAYSEATPMAHRSNHADLIEPTRELLQTSGKPYVIENVESARHLLHEPVMLCGSMFGLHLWRHRYFEIWPRVFALLSPCIHKHRLVTATIDGALVSVQTPVLCTGGGDGKLASRRTHRPRQPVKEVRWAMEIDWMVQNELTEAIPPAYSRWIGLQLLAAVTP